VVTTKKLFDVVGGFSPEYDGAQDYDLVLKLSEQAQRVIHIPLEGIGDLKQYSSR